MTVELQMSETGMSTLQPTLSRSSHSKKEAVYNVIVEKCRKTKAIKKIKNLDFYQIEEQDVEEFFEIADINQCGHIAKKHLKTLIHLSCNAEKGTILHDQLSEFVEAMDTDHNGEVDLQEMINACLAGDFAMTQLCLQNEGKARRSKNSCKREHLLQWLHHEHNRNDSCFSLPFAIFFFFVMAGAVLSHLQVRDVFLSNDALIGELADRKYPYLLAADGVPYVADRHSIWQYMEDQFVPGVFRQDYLASTGALEFSPGRVATFNKLVGGARIVNHMRKPERCDSPNWLSVLYDNQDGMCHEPTDNLANYTKEAWLWYPSTQEELLKQVRDLKNSDWINVHTEEVSIHMLFYNGQIKLFNWMEIRFKFYDHGHLNTKFVTEVFDPWPYRSWVNYALDGLYLFMVVYLFYMEAKEMLPAIKNGWDGFTDYMQFWNVIDWLSIILGFALTISWMIYLGGMTDIQAAAEACGTDGGCQYTITDHEISWSTAIITEGKYLNSDIFPNPDHEAAMLQLFGNMHDNFVNLTGKLGAVKVIILLLFFVMIMRFFKAFRANPRLSVVTDTLSRASTDLFHFTIVFLTIYIVFVLEGMVMFGHRMKDYSDFINAFNYGFRVLMGEFDFDQMFSISPIYATIWFWVFNFAVLLVIFNMLLAIVMDTYTTVKEGGDDAETIWEQMFSTMNYLVETYSFVSMWSIICELEDDDAPAHPASWVTAETLRSAFADIGMSAAQSEYYIRKAIQFRVTNDKRAAVPSTAQCVRLLSRLNQLAVFNEEKSGLLLNCFEELRDVQVSSHRTFAKRLNEGVKLALRQHEEMMSYQQPAAAVSPSGSPTNMAGNTQSDSFDQSGSREISPTSARSRKNMNNSGNNFNSAAVDQVAAMSRRIASMVEHVQQTVDVVANTQALDRADFIVDKIRNELNMRGLSATDLKNTIKKHAEYIETGIVNFEMVNDGLQAVTNSSSHGVFELNKNDINLLKMAYQDYEMFLFCLESAEPLSPRLNASRMVGVSAQEAVAKEPRSARKKPLNKPGIKPDSLPKFSAFVNSQERRFEKHEDKLNHVAEKVDQLTSFMENAFGQFSSAEVYADVRNNKKRIENLEQYQQHNKHLDTTDNLPGQLNTSQNLVFEDNEHKDDSTIPLHMRPDYVKWIMEQKNTADRLSNVEGQLSEVTDMLKMVVGSLQYSEPGDNYDEGYVPGELPGIPEDVEDAEEEVAPQQPTDEEPETTDVENPEGSII